MVLVEDLLGESVDLRSREGGEVGQMVLVLVLVQIALCWFSERIDEDPWTVSSLGRIAYHGS